MKSHASMNRIYRLVWNETLNLWVAVAENAKGRGKGGRAASALALDMLPGQGAQAVQTGDPAGFTLKSACRAALVLLAAIGLGMPLAHAGPEGGTVVGGTASITQSGANTTINQSSQRTAIDWNSFSTAGHESIVFNQPNAQAVALNRITGSSPSELLGSLTANGQVFILNPNGVLFGAGAQVNVGGLVASTLSMSNADFMAGNHVFSKEPGSG
ncbi:MAG: filamentous hemagglutinin N-terminal domain-containing protein, partial [Pseudomonadota bacterium]